MTVDDVLSRWPFLSRRQAEAVALYEQGMSPRQIARELGITHAAVRGRLDLAEHPIAESLRGAAA